MYAKMYGCDSTAVLAIEERISTKHFDFFACFDPLIGFKCYDRPAPGTRTREQMRSFASMIGGKLKRGGVLLFSSYFKGKDKYIIVDNDNWNDVYKNLVPAMHLNERETLDLMREKEAEKVERVNRRNEPAMKMFHAGMPDQTYKKLGKRGFNTTFDQAKHDFEVAEFDKGIRKQSAKVFSSLGMEVRGIIHNCEDARFRERQAQREQNRRPIQISYTER